MSVKSTYEARDGLKGGEKNRATVPTSLRLAFRGHDRTFMSLIFIN